MIIIIVYFYLFIYLLNEGNPLYNIRIYDYKLFISKKAQKNYYNYNIIIIEMIIIIEIIKCT